MKRIFVNRKYTYLISFLFHCLLLLLFSFISLGSGVNEIEYVTVDFGSPGAGRLGSKEAVEDSKNLKEEQVTQEEVKEKIDAPKVRQDFDEVVKNEKKDIENKKISQSKNVSESKGSAKTNTGEQLIGSGGFSFDWGGRGTRKILRWEKPKFPPNVQKEIDIKIKFIILPDGSVVSPVPLIKADTQLEDAAIQALKTWKFEPLRPDQVQFEQTVIITIPYRLE